MLPSKRREPFDDPDWIFELKWGGVRALAFVDGEEVRLVGQNRRELTPAYPELQALAGQVRARSAVLDGEIIGLGPKGKPDLALLQERLRRLAGQLGGLAGGTPAAHTGGTPALPTAPALHGRESPF